MIRSQGLASTEDAVVPQLGGQLKSSEQSRRARSARLAVKQESGMVGGKRKMAVGTKAKALNQAAASAARLAVEDEKERKRLKRLLRNRVSAQQARERKKQYLSTLERRSKELETTNAEMVHRVKTLEMEVMTLRTLLKSYMSGSGGVSVEEVVQHVSQIVAEKMEGIRIELLEHKSYEEIEHDDGYEEDDLEDEDDF